MIKLLNERGKLQRTIDLSRVQSVMLLVAADQHQKVVSVKTPREYDLVSMNVSVAAVGHE